MLGRTEEATKRNRRPPGNESHIQPVRGAMSRRATGGSRLAIAPTRAWRSSGEPDWRTQRIDHGYRDQSGFGIPCPRPGAKPIRVAPYPERQGKVSSPIISVRIPGRRETGLRENSSEIHESVARHHARAREGEAFQPQPELAATLGQPSFGHRRQGWCPSCKINRGKKQPAAGHGLLLTCTGVLKRGSLARPAATAHNGRSTLLPES
jgi:hypothetical protein